MITNKTHTDEALAKAETEEMAGFLTSKSGEDLHDLTVALLKDVTNPFTVSVFKQIIEALREGDEDGVTKNVPDAFLMMHMMISILDYMSVIFKDKGGDDALVPYLLTAMIGISDVKNTAVLNPLAMIEMRRQAKNKDTDPKIIIDDIIARMKAL